MLPDNVPILGYNCTLFGVHAPCVSILESLHLFLSARYPNLDKRDPLIRWRGIWNTRRVWRSAFEFDSQLAVAVEIRRMIMGNEPAFERVRAVLEKHLTASEIPLLKGSHSVALPSC